LRPSAKQQVEAFLCKAIIGCAIRAWESQRSAQAQAEQRAHICIIRKRSDPTSHQYCTGFILAGPTKTAEEGEARDQLGQSVTPGTRGKSKHAMLYFMGFP
jgi:hypothetical protein